LETPKNIEFRSEEIQDILGSVPSRIIRIGISIVFCILALILFGTWFFKYPDIIQAKVTLYTKTPPVALQARTNGKIKSLFATENQQVSKSDIVAIIENTAKYSDIQTLKNILDTLHYVKELYITSNLELGELQSAYSSFLKHHKEYWSFIKIAYHQNQINSVKSQISDQLTYLKILHSQKEIKATELNLVKIQYKRDNDLFEKGIYSKLDFEKSQKNYLQEKLSYNNAQSTFTNTNMQINQLKQKLKELNLLYLQEKQNKEIALNESIENLKSLIKSWEMKFILKSPIDGKITLTKIWSKNQNINIGETVATIIPTNNSDIIGRLEIPTTGIGKVKINQPINIKLDNFPYMEFGLLRGTISNISLVPTTINGNTIYTAEMNVPDSLISNYGEHLKFNQEMTGKAEILTDDTRLLERLLHPLKLISKENIYN
jgi:HlyD family secretion protein